MHYTSQRRSNPQSSRSKRGTRKITTFGLGVGMVLVAAITVSAQTTPKRDLIEGSEGFFFTGLNDLKFYATVPKEHAERVDRDIRVIAGLSRALERRGVRVVFSFVPMVERINEAYLPKELPLPQMFRDFYGRSLASLTKQGVFAPDLNTPFLKHPARKDLAFPLYLRQDNHWSSLGGIEGARVIADAMRAKLNTTLTDLPEIKSKLVWNEPIEFNGNYYKLFTDAERVRLPKERIRPVQFLPDDTPSQTTSDATTLFGDQAPGIAVIGTSFTENRAFGFAAGIGHFLSRETLNVAESGKGPWTPLGNYLGSEDFQNTPPKIVVWEFPEGFLARAMSPVGNSNVTAPERLRYLYQAGANIGGDCGGQATAEDAPTLTVTGGTVTDGQATLTAGSTPGSVKIAFNTPIRSDEYLSVSWLSANANGVAVEGASKAQGFELTFKPSENARRLNLGLYAVADGKTKAFTVRVPAGTDLVLGDVRRCKMPSDVMELLPK